MPRIKQTRDYVSECISLKDASAKDLGLLSPTGRPSRMAQRMRRAGVALDSIEGLKEKVKGLPLREILPIAEKAIAGLEIEYED
jgi:hypothetical protein